MTRSLRLRFLPTVKESLYIPSSTVPAAEEAATSLYFGPCSTPCSASRRLPETEAPTASAFPVRLHFARRHPRLPLNVTGSPAHRRARPRLPPASCAPPNDERPPSALYVEGERVCCAPLAHLCILSSLRRRMWEGI